MQFNNLLNVMQTFDSEKKCINHLAKLRWPNGLICPKCGGNKRINQYKSRPLWRCGDCKKQFSVRIGTIFENSKIKLQKWIMSIWLRANHKKVISAHQLACDIKVTEKAAQFILGRLCDVIPKASIDPRKTGGERVSDEPHAPLTFDEVLRCCIGPVVPPEPFTNVVCGDCLKLLPKVSDSSVHLVITDPPYFLDGLDTDWKKGKAGVTRGTGSVGGLPVGMKFDPKQGVALQDFITRTGKHLFRVMMPGSFAIMFSQPRLSHRMAIGLEDAGFQIRDLFAWHFTRRAQFKAFSMDHFVDRMDMEERQKVVLKRRLGGRKTPQLRPQFEVMILAQRPRIGTFIDNWVEHRTGLIDSKASLDGMAPSTVMRVEKPHREKYNGHLTVKPIMLIEHLIRLFSEPGQVVLDPFLGSGTTAIAAFRTERSCMGMEINADYVKIAEKRIKEATK